MATMKELRQDINSYLYLNITKFDFDGDITYQLNDIWVDKRKLLF